MSTAKKIGVLLIFAGLLLPVASLGFMEGYNPTLGFVGSLPQLKVVFVEQQTAFQEETRTTREIQQARAQGQRWVLKGQKYYLVTTEETALHYSLVLALSCVLVGAGTAVVIFKKE